MASLLMLPALALVAALVYLIVGNPLVDRDADRATLHRLTGKDDR